MGHRNRGAVQGCVSGRFNAYREHCISNATTVLKGMCPRIAISEAVTGPKHWIACLFTSKEYGLKKDGPDNYLKNTELAVMDLLVKLRQARERGDIVGTLGMCKINLGKFGVPWESTEAVLEGIRLDGEIKVEIWDRRTNSPRKMLVWFTARESI